MHKFRKTAQPQPRQMPQPGLSLRRPVRPLTAAAQMLERKHIQVFPIPSFQIAILPKRVPQKVQACPWFPQVHHLRLFPVDLQLEFPFQP